MSFQCKSNKLLLILFQQQEQDPTNLYISNLPLSMDEQELENMLKPFGQVISTRILRDSSGTSRGVGFARYFSGVSHPAAFFLFFNKKAGIGGKGRNY